MTEAGFSIRPGTAQDSRPAFDVFLPAITDLARRSGTPWDPDPETLWTRVESMFDHSPRTPPNGGSRRTASGR